MCVYPADVLTFSYSWEMSTIGHPLSDICNFTMSFYMANAPGAGNRSLEGFKPGKTPGMPQPDQIVKWYVDAGGYDPRADMKWGMAFCIFKLAGVCQGIAARYAQRQASSEKAKEHAKTRVPLAMLASYLASQVGDGASPKL